jgi:hypothetical protein
MRKSTITVLGSSIATDVESISDDPDPQVT